MAYEPTQPRAISKSVENALVDYLYNTGDFDGCSIVAYSTSDESPPTFPTIIVQSESYGRTDDTPLEMYSKTVNVLAELSIDSEQSTEGQYETLARCLESWMESLPEMQDAFNVPDSGDVDHRKVRGLHLHYIDDVEITAQTDGTVWTFGMKCSLILDEVIT